VYLVGTTIRTNIFPPLAYNGVSQIHKPLGQDSWSRGVLRSTREHVVINEYMMGGGMMHVQEEINAYSFLWKGRSVDWGNLNERDQEEG
jgi:hypothetical protein